jgi:hypothetical protein
MYKTRRSPFSSPRLRLRGNRYIHSELMDVLKEGSLIGQMQYKPDSRGWSCHRFADGARSFLRVNKQTALNWIGGEVE